LRGRGVDDGTYVYHITNPRAPMLLSSDDISHSRIHRGRRHHIGDGPQHRAGDCGGVRRSNAPLGRHASTTAASTRRGSTPQSDYIATGTLTTSSRATQETDNFMVNNTASNQELADLTVLQVPNHFNGNGVWDSTRNPLYRCR
jgi:hypothetical protein